jgi:hypothetical protein
MLKAMKKSFTAKLVTFSHGKLTRLIVPASVAKSFGSLGRVWLQGTINRFPFRTSLFRLQDGTNCILVNSEMRKGAKAKAGDTVEVTLERSSTVRHVEVPADIQRALAKSRKAKAAFDKLTPSHKRAYIDYVGQFTRPEARKQRIEQMIEELLAAKAQRSK